MSESHLIIALSRYSWGRVVMARTMASELSAMGDAVTFLIDEGLSPLMDGATFRCESINVAMGPLLKLYINDLILSQHPTTIILADYFANANFCYSVGANPRDVLFKDIVTFSLDPWEFECTGFDVDMFYKESWPLASGNAEECAEQFRSIPYKLRPVPIVAPTNATGDFSNLPYLSETRLDSTRHLRHSLGIGDGAKAVLFCTAKWQHVRYESEAGMRLASSLPILVAEYLSRMGEDIHLVHVGPQAYDLKGKLDGRYHWLPPLPPPNFDSILNSMDLLLSANVSATTIAKAMVFEVPTLVLHNSILAETREEAESALARPFSENLRLWLNEALPLFPFVLWPLGYSRFLAPLLRNNPYVDALEFVEMLDENRVESALSALLFDPGARAEQAHRQACYLKQVRSLPTGAQIIKTTIGG